MDYKTYGQLKAKVLNDLGLEQEQFISEEEMLGYCNEAIDDCESEIHTAYEDYFLTSSKINLVKGQALYSLPTNIYANKLRGVLYNNGENFYPITRFKRTKDMFEQLALQDASSSSQFNFILLNSSAEAGVKMRLSPVPKKDETEAVELHYIRNANKMVDDDSICDIPEFTSYVIQFMKVRCYEKEGHPNLAASASMLEALKKKMTDTLANMVPDGDDELVGDTTFYEEMV